MALDTNAALLRLSPTGSLGFDLPDKKAQSMERERLALMREQFEEAKRQNAQDAEWRKIAEAGAMTREQMASDRQAEHDRQTAVAENIKQRTLAFDSFNKRVESADYEGMDLDAKRINELGGLAEEIGRDENGFPSYRIEFDAEAARKRDAEQEEQTTAIFDDSGEDSGSALPRESIPQSLDRMNALGYDTLGLRGNMTGTGVGEAQPLSTEDAFRSAQRAARGPDEAAAAAPEPAAPAPWQPGNLDRDEPEPEPIDPGASTYDLAGEADAAKDFAVEGRSTPMTPPPGLEPSIFQATGRPARGPDQRDIMGGVPKNVIDTGSMQDQRKQRLGPVMAAIERSMPQAYRGMARDADEAALGTGLPADKALEFGFKQRGQSAGLLGSELEAERKGKEAARKAAADAALDPVEQQKLIKYGRDAARGNFDRNGIKESIATIEAVKTVEHLLSDKHPENDDYAINFLMKLAEQKGTQSDRDAMRMDGISAASTTEQVKAWLKRHIEGGTYEPLKAAMLSFATRQREKERDTAFSWMESEQALADKAEHPLEGKGRNEVIESLPAWLRKEYNDSLEEEEEDEPAGGSASPSRASLYQAPPPAAPSSAPPTGGLQNDQEFMTSLTQNAEAYDVDPDKMLAIMGPESGGNPAAKNAGSSASGLIQMIDSVARGYINPRTNKNFESASELRELTRAEQAPIAAKYFADRGVTTDSPTEDYALAVAAPAFVGRSAERDTVVYPKGSKEHAINRPWWPEDGGDVTVGSLLDFYMGKGKGGKKSPAAPTATASTDTDDDQLEGI